MNLQFLARKLTESDAKERAVLLKKHEKLCNVELASKLQEICYEIWTSEPLKVSIIAETLGEISRHTKNPEIEAYAQWTAAIENLLNGRLENCLSALDESERLFKENSKFHAAATTQISKLYALALLGRYDQAVECGRRARQVFLAEKDAYSVGKIEQNIGNLYLRRDFYAEAEPYFKSARRFFSRIGDASHAAMLDNNLAFIKAAQNRFREAEKIYERGLKRAEKHDLTAIQADIEANLSNLHLFRGKYDLALKFLERARQKFERLAMPHQMATAELEIADIYLELNLLPEAIGFYEKTEAGFAALGMQAELARSFRNHAKALFELGETESSAALLEKAEKLFAAEGNLIAAAAAKLVKAQILFSENEFGAAETESQNAMNAFSEGGNLRQKLFANWLLGEVKAARGETEKARVIFEETLALSAQQSRQIEFLCLVSLGKLASDEKLFLKAVEIAENSRTELAAEDFRAAFLSDKILPYNELVKIKIRRKDFVEAFLWHERSRARALRETLNGAANNPIHNENLETLREELNWYYSRLNRQNRHGLEARKEAADLRKHAEKLEKEYAEQMRRSQVGGNPKNKNAKDFDLSELQKSLTNAALIEFAMIDGKVTAFVVTSENLEVFAHYADEKTLNAEITQFLFQIKTARLQKTLSPENQRIAFERLLRHARKIYDALLRPLEKFINERVIFVPAGFLHYLPFQALHDGEKFLVERTEISFAPSAAVLLDCLQQKFAAPQNALLAGVADKLTPLVETEIETLGGIFPHSVRLLDKKATLKNLRQNLGRADLLHLACHGAFRPDNPAFSSLALDGENLTVTDARNLDLKNKFVALSACETGLSKIVPGEEIIGLARGFLAAGAVSMLLSLWTVNDRSTLELMQIFYRAMLDGKNPAAALQTAQIALLEKNPHPFFWSPFVLIGHW